jgi:cell wall-associated NlpC family hydrolase
VQLVVQTAIDAMGSPYAWGGSGANGFDCSGLIQYAYARHGISLPRRSSDQARVGVLVPREIDQLLPGDILTFASSPGGPVSHVGLYVGDRRFIHSASDGVRLSRLSADDPLGAHWWDRWLGARRMVSPSPAR